MFEKQWYNYAVNLFNNVLRDPPGSRIYIKYLGVVADRFQEEYEYNHMLRLAGAAVENRETNIKKLSAREIQERPPDG